MVKENAMKQTEIGLIPEDWEIFKIEELTPSNIKYTIVDGPFGSNLKTIHYRKKGIPIITSGYVTDGKFFASSYLFVDIEKFKQEKRSSVQPGDIVMAKIGERCGASAILPLNHPESILSGNALKIKIDNKRFSTNLISQILYNDYLRGKLNELRTIGAQPAISMANLKKYKIPLPPLAEQEAIAAALSDCDAWIESLEAVIAKKRLIKQGAMQKLLTPKEEWEVKKLGEVADIIGGGTPSTFMSKYWNGNIEWFTPTEVGYSKYLYSSRRKISDLGFKNASANLLPKNSILLTSRAGIGDLGILKIEACTNQGFQSIVCKENIDFEFIYYLMSTKKDDLLRNASGSTFLEISPNKVKSLEIEIPSLSEQTRIATVLSDMDAELEALGQKLNKARQIKQGMMQELLTGRVRLV